MPYGPLRPDATMPTCKLLELLSVTPADMPLVAIMVNALESIVSKIVIIDKYSFGFLNNLYIYDVLSISEIYQQTLCSAQIESIFF
jgi:hypothetical protein